MGKMKCMLEVELPDADAAAEALSHEGSVGSRASAKIRKKEKSLEIEITAKDVVALRATANAYLRALQVFESVEEVRK